MILLISADLNSTNKVYDGFYATIKAVPLYWHYLEHVWLVKTDEDSHTWVTRLRAQINEQTDFLVVTKVDLAEYDGWLPPQAWEWIRENRENSTIPPASP